MSRRDPRAEPDEDFDANHVERPFQRASTLSVDSSTALPSESQVRAVITPLPHAAVAARVKLDSELGERAATDEEVKPAAAETPSLPPIPPPVVVTPSMSALDLETVEHLLDQGQWQALHDLLGPADRAAELPPHLALVYALACSETQSDALGQTIEFAIHSAARAHGLPDTSPIVRIIAKRLLRKAPTSWRSRPAPPRKISALIVLIALTLGGGTGFWLSTTHVKIPLPGFLLR